MITIKLNNINKINLFEMKNDKNVNEYDYLRKFAYFSHKNHRI